MRLPTCCHAYSTLPCIQYVAMHTTCCHAYNMFSCWQTPVLVARENAISIMLHQGSLRLGWVMPCKDLFRNFNLLHWVYFRHFTVWTWLRTVDVFNHVSWVNRTTNPSLPINSIQCVIYSSVLAICSVIPTIQVIWMVKWDLGSMADTAAWELCKVNQSKSFLDKSSLLGLHH